MGSKVSVEKVCKNLVRTGAARKVGGRLAAVPHGPILYPPGSKEQSAYHLGVLHSILLNIEHNAHSTPGARWFERQSVSHNFPESALSTYSAETSKRAQAFLQQEDATMHRIARFTPSTGRAVRATVHMLFSARPLDSSGPLPSASKATATSAERQRPMRRPRTRRRVQKA